MLKAIAIASITFSALCFAYLGWLWRFGVGHVKRAPQPLDTGLALGFAVAFLLIGAAVAAIDAKIADANSSLSGKPASKTGAPAATADYPFPAGEVDSFRGRITFHWRPISSSRCLVGYFDRARSTARGARSYRWWTSCREAARLKTVRQIRARLALPSEWGERDARIFLRVPRDTPLTYMRGVVAPQYSKQDGGIHRGGATQYRLLEFDRRWVVRVECLASRSTSSRAVFEPCPQGEGDFVDLHERAGGP